MVNELRKAKKIGAAKGGVSSKKPAPKAKDCTAKTAQASKRPACETTVKTTVEERITVERIPPGPGADEAVENIGNRKVGAAMMIGGLALAVLPGLPGLPLVVLGSAMLSPSVRPLRPVDRWLNKKFPGAREEALSFYSRFTRDFEKRYPAES